MPGATAESPGQRIGAYRLVEQVGEGGMGMVWRAEQVEPMQRQVALRLIQFTGSMELRDHWSG